MAAVAGVVNQDHAGDGQAAKSIQGGEALFHKSSGYGSPPGWHDFTGDQLPLDHTHPQQGRWNTEGNAG
ncbi:hypothetical protein ES703_13774 [subsurface metagenome]